MIRDTVEYVKFWLYERDGKDVTADAVKVALVEYGDSPTWLDCTFLTTGTYRGRAVTWWQTSTPLAFSAANYPEGRYRAYAMVTDSPETPWVDLGYVLITAH